MSSTADVVVIGAGPAGVMAAAHAAELSTVLVTQHSIGGMAANDGPVPVRTLAHTARLMRNARQLGQYGVVINEPALDYQQLLERVSEVTSDIRERSTLRALTESHGGVIQESTGPVHFEDAHTIANKATNVVQVASIALAAGMRRVDDLARAAVSFPTYAEILIATAVRAAKQLEIGWRTHYTA